MDMDPKNRHGDMGLTYNMELSDMQHGLFLLSICDMQNNKGRHQNSKDVVTNLPLKLATSGN